MTKRLTLLTLFCIFMAGVFSQTSEYEMKAVALEKLALFIDWPKDADESRKNEFVIAVLGKNPIGKILEDVYKTHKIKEKNVKVIYINDIRQLTDCQMLYIPKVKKSTLIDILDRVKSLPVLTISETEGYARAGCYINFFNLKGKLRFEINQNAMKSAGFNVDYKLLHVARIVNSGSG